MIDFQKLLDQLVGGETLVTVLESRSYEFRMEESDFYKELTPTILKAIFSKKKKEVSGYQGITRSYDHGGNRSYFLYQGMTHETLTLIKDKNIVIEHYKFLDLELSAFMHTLMEINSLALEHNYNAMEEEI